VWHRPVDCRLWLDFGELGGARCYNLVDPSQYGTVYGAVWARGKPIGCLEADGVDDRVDVEGYGQLSLKGPVTVEAVVQPYRYGYNECWLTGGRQYILWQQANGEIRFADTQGNYVDSGPVDLRGGVHHVVGVFRGAEGDPVTLENAEIWLDGENMATHTAGAWSPTTMDRLSLLYVWYINGYFFGGRLHHARVYGYGLAAREIRAHHNYLKYALLEAP